MQKTHQALLLILVSILSVSFLAPISAQSTEGKTAVNWNKTFGPVYGANILAMEDGGCVIVGTTGQWVQTHGPGNWFNESTVLIKIDSQGNIQWTKNYSSFGYINDAMLTSDNGFAILAGRTLCKIDSQGALQWNKTYATFPDRSDVHVTSAIQTSDNGFLIGGLGGAAYYEGRLVKTDSEGNMLWSKTYGGGAQASSKINSVVEADDGYVFAGSTGHLKAGQQNIWLVKISRMGDILWEKGYGEGDKQVGECYALTKSSDGGFVFSGFYIYYSPDYHQSCFVARTDSEGIIQWKQTARIAFTTIGQTKEGGYIFAGSNGDMGIVSKYSASGRFQWTQDFAKGEDAYILSVVVASDGSYIFTGYKGVERNKQMWAFKIPYDNLPAETFTPTQTVNPSSTLQAWAVPLTVLIVIVAFIVGLTVLFKRKKAHTKS